MNVVPNWMEKPPYVDSLGLGKPLVPMIEKILGMIGWDPSVCIQLIIKAIK
jgi:hypothetical protein